MLRLKKVYYYGTTKGKSWWRRYSGDGWLMRGAAELWIDDEGIHFKRLLTSSVQTIPFQDIQGIEFGKWHAGKWTGVDIVKIIWQKDGMTLVSGFSLSKKKEETQKYVQMIMERVNKQKN